MTVEADTYAHPPETPDRRVKLPETQVGVAGATIIIALGNFSSRILGLVREIILANLFGAGMAVDAFRIAVIVPRNLYDLMIGGHVNSALVPVLSEYAEHKDEENLWSLVNALLSMAVIFMGMMVIGIELIAPWIISIIADPSTSDDILREATYLLRITAPALFFLTLFAVLSSLLYALRRFTLPAFAASAFNLTIVIITMALAPRIGIRAAALGWLIGAMVQFTMQWPALRHTRIRLFATLWHPGIRTLGKLYVPVMFSLSLDVLVIRVFSYHMASRAGEGSISYMEWATTLMQFPHGLVATAISIAVLPTLSRQASGVLSEFKTTLGLGLRLALALIIPATLGLIVLAIPVVALIFEHGEFNSTDTAITAFALRLYLIGLPFATMDLLLIFAFYARQDTLTPAVIGLLSRVAYIIVAIGLFPYWSFFALMIADSTHHFIHASVSAWLLKRRTGALVDERIFSTAWRASFAAGLMGIAAWFFSTTLAPLADYGTKGEIVLVGVSSAVSGLLYLWLAHRLGIGEIQLFFHKFKQRFASNS